MRGQDIKSLGFFLWYHCCWVEAMRLVFCLLISSFLFLPDFLFQANFSMASRERWGPKERDIPTVPSACLAQCASSCFHVSFPSALPLTSCPSPFYTKAKNGLSGEQRVPPMAIGQPWTVQVSGTLRLVSQPWKETILKV